MWFPQQGFTMPPQAHIRGYELLERIGSGAESAIYRARELSSGRIVAIKHVVADNAENEKYLRHVRNEYKVLRSLQDGAGAPPKGIVRAYRLMNWGSCGGTRNTCWSWNTSRGRTCGRSGAIRSARWSTS